MWSVRKRFLLERLTLRRARHLPIDTYNLRFPGQYFDAESGLNYNYHRDYDSQVGRYIEGDPIGLIGGSLSTYTYADGTPISEIDPLGLWGWGDPVPQSLVDYTAGFGDAASLDLTLLIRHLTDTNGGVDQCSSAYRAGALTSLALGAGRLAYAGLAKAGSIFASSGAAASAFRSGLRTAFGGGAGFRPPDLSKYATDEALRQAAGRTNLPANLWGGGAAAGGAVGASGCGCKK